VIDILKIKATLFSIYTNYKIIIHNYLYMNTLKILTIIVPLFTYPYLIKTLGSETYGLVIWGWAIVELFIIFINFGFDITATKNISIHRNDKFFISKILSYTILIKFSFLLISLFLIFCLSNFITQMQTNKDLLLLIFLIAIPESLLPLWYFKGIEKMKYVAIIVSLTKILFAFLIFTFITDKSDYKLVPVLYFISGMISVLFAYYIIIFKDKMFFSKFKFNEIITAIKESSSVFGSNSVMVIREKFNLILIERFVGLEALAFFDIIQKFVNVLITPFHILAATIYPHVSRTKNINFVIKITLASLVVSFIVYIFQYVFSDMLVKFLYGSAHPILENILLILSITVPLGALSAFIGINILVVFNKNKYYFFSSLIATLTNFLLFLLFYLFNYKFNIIWFTVVTVIVFGIELLSRIVFSKDLILKNKE
jgi:O-antigen/teichoic acid export membrane protein